MESNPKLWKVGEFEYIWIQDCQQVRKPHAVPRAYSFFQNDEMK